MKIAEIFHSIQGEGKLSGIPSAFVRTSGCNLRCTWCDTPYASWDPQGRELPVPEIVAQVLAYRCHHAVVTGGEPLIHKDLPDLVHQLRTAGLHVTLETAGTLWREMPLDLASVSPKLANSTPHQREGGRFARVHEEHRLNLATLRHFATAPHIPERQWKFVVAQADDLAEIQRLLAQIGEIPPSDVLLMPEGTTPEVLAERAVWLAEVCKTHGYRLCPRLQVWLFGDTPGT